MHRHHNQLRQLLTQVASWSYGIMSTVPYEQQKSYRSNLIFILFTLVYQPASRVADRRRPVNRQLVMMSMSYVI